MPQEIPIPTDGILGRDFLVNYRCIIDYDTWTLSGYSKQSENFELTIEDTLNGDLILPPRCEVFRKLDTQHLKEDFVLDATELRAGVFCSNAIISSKNSIVKIINTTNNTVKIKNTCPTTITPLTKYDILTFDQTKQELRNEKLFEELNVKDINIDTNTKRKLIQLCEKYNTLFALPTDTLTHNNFYKQQINLNDESPVYIKNYR